MPWEAPYRPQNEITQTYNDGYVVIYSVTDEAAPGYQPTPKLKRKITLRYAEQRLGIQRYYAGRQNQIDIERVIRTPNVGIITNQDVAITEDGRQYRIDMVQTAQGIYPVSIDITLAKIDQEYEVANT